MADLLNDFWKAAESERHLTCYKGAIRRARPYSLDDDAVGLITELSSGPSITDKLSIYRLLARLPFEEIFIEFNYQARFDARKRLGTARTASIPESAPDVMGWLLKRLSDTSWKATTVVRFRPDQTASGREVDTFGVTHVVSTEGPLKYRSIAKDPIIQEVINTLNDEMLFPAIMWGLAADVEGSITGSNVSYPEHLCGTNAIEIDPSWEHILQTAYGTRSERERRALYRKQIESAGVELMGDLRFITTALATLNEVPMTFRDVRPQGSMRIGGRVREYMVNRVVTIALPKKRGLTTKVLKMLRLAEIRMRRHEVSGYFRRVRHADGTVERRWVKDYMRGDASLGYVRQEREVTAP